MRRPICIAYFAALWTLAACQLLLPDAAPPGAPDASDSVSDGGVDVFVEATSPSDDSAALDAPLVDAPTDAGGAYREAVLADSPLAYYDFDATRRMAFRDNPDAEVFASVVNGDNLLGVFRDGGLNTGVPGVIGLGVSFPRTESDFIGADTLYNFVNSTSFTLECWVRPVLKADGVNVIISKRAGDNGYQLDMFRDNLSAETTFTIGDDAAVSTLTITEDAGPADPSSEVDLGWRHMVAVFDGSAKVGRLYVNGTLKIAGAAINLPTAHSNPFQIGWRFRGYIDELALYDYALPHGRIGVHYNAAPPR